jgi:hypothetical protein
MIHHNPIPVAVSNPDNAVHKKKKRKNKKKKAAKKVVDESSSDSDSDNEDLAFMTASQFHSNAPRGSSKPKPAVAYHTNQLGSFPSLPLRIFLLIFVPSLLSPSQMIQ